VVSLSLKKHAMCSGRREQKKAFPLFLKLRDLSEMPYYLTLNFGTSSTVRLPPMVDEWISGELIPRLYGSLGC
jgi:hypothetical protein